MFRALRLLPMLLAASLLCSCDWAGLAYDHLDLLARHYVAGFVDLRPQQQQAFDLAFDEFWRWHRSSELPRYAETARAIAKTSQSLQTPAQIDAQLTSLDHFIETSSQHLLDEIAPLLTTLDDAQVQQILAEIDKRIEKSAHREARLDDAHWRRKQAEQMHDQLQKYAGPLQPVQEQMLRDWSQTLMRDEAVDHRAALAWRAQMAEVLQRRHEAGNRERVQALTAVQNPDITAFEHSRAAMHQRYVALLTDFSNSYTAQQRQHLQTAFDDLAADLEKLAAEPPAAK